MKKAFKVSAIVVGSLLLVAGGFFGWFFYQMRDLKAIESAKISDSLFVVKGGYCNVYLVKNKDSYIAFDGGDKPANIAESCKTLSIEPAAVKAVFLTHSDADHVDGLVAFPNAKVYISNEEIPLLKDKTHRHFLGMTHMNKLPVEQYTTLTDGEIIDIDGLKVEAIATPGHTQGSTSYKVGDALFTGDLCIVVNGQVREMVKMFTEDMGIDKASIKKISQIKDIKGIYTAHSGYTNDMAKAFELWQ